MEPPAYVVRYIDEGYLLPPNEYAFNSNKPSNNC